MPVDRRLRVILAPEKTIDYLCLNLACERYERPTPVKINAGAEKPMRHHAAGPPKLDVEPLPMFALPPPVEQSDRLSCYVCGSPLSPA